MIIRGLIESIYSNIRTCTVKNKANRIFRVNTVGKCKTPGMRCYKCVITTNLSVFAIVQTAQFINKELSYIFL